MNKLQKIFLFFLFLSPPVLSQGVQSENWYYVPGDFVVLDTVNTFSYLSENTQIFSIYGYTLPGTIYGGGWSMSTNWSKNFGINYVTPDTFFIKLKISEKLNLYEIRIGLALQDTLAYSSGLSYAFEANGEWQTVKIETESWLKIYNPNFYKAYLLYLHVSLDSCKIGSVIEVDDFGGIYNSSGDTIMYDDFNYGITSVISEQVLSNFALEQNYPNPFNPSTTIKFTVPELEQVNLIVYNSLGQEVKTLVSEEKSIGNYEVSFDASGLPSGVYFYRLQAGSFVETKKMLLLK